MRELLAKAGDSFDFTMLLCLGLTISQLNDMVARKIAVRKKMRRWFPYRFNKRD